MNVPFAAAAAVAALCSAAVTTPVSAQNPPPLPGALARMPVREVTVFKDGHAFVLHEGRVATAGDGTVVLDNLPNPVLGTFWPYSAGGKGQLLSVVAGRRRVSVERTALSLRELLEANVGAPVLVTEVGDKPPYQATIVSVPTRPAVELEPVGSAAGSENAPRFVAGGADERLPQKGSLILLKTANGVKALDMARIQDVTFTESSKAKLAGEEYRSVLTLKMDWPGAGAPPRAADVGMMYLQKGLRWIPNYRVVIDGKGGARVKLQATLINELADLENVTANLVIGVPTFAFKETPDPIGLQDTVAQLGRFFQDGSRTGTSLSNGIMTQQVARSGEYYGDATTAGGAETGPAIGSADKNEDLFVFTVKNVSLKKGQRMVLPVTEFAVEYKDVYTLELPFAPPREARADHNNQQQAEMARLLASPKVMHTIRLCNTSPYPITTAPALVLQNDRVLSQGMLTYASRGADADLPLTAAVDIRVKKTDKETQRTADAMQWADYKYARVDLAGVLTLTNYKDQPVTIEVKRFVAGEAKGATQNGDVERINTLEDGDGGGPTLAGWSAAYGGWPAWWNHVNTISRITWKMVIPPKKSASLNYNWSYYWR